VINAALRGTAQFIALHVVFIIPMNVELPLLHRIDNAYLPLRIASNEDMGEWINNQCL
jgi:hypothetical protein